MPAPHPPNAELRWKRVVAIQLGLILALVGALSILWMRAPDSGQDAVQRLLENEELKREAIERLVQGGAGIYDSFLDADVGRILQPDLDGREFQGVPIHSNSYGMREREYSWPRAGDGLRIVLLGDSYVFGYGIEERHRVGAQLERMLAARLPDTDIEVLHLAVSGWSLRASSAYLRRQLSQIRPDLVVQVVIQNDLNDSYGTRGFGATSNFDPSQPERANGTTRMVSPSPSSGNHIVNPLPLAIDFEGRRRYAEAAQRLGQLATAVEAIGGEYLVLCRWTRYQPMVRSHLVTELRQEQWAHIGDAFANNLRFVRARDDKHWNPEGSRRMAMLIYGLITQRGLLADLKLPRWRDADEAVRVIHQGGARDAAQQAAIQQWIRRFDLRPRLGFGPTSDHDAAQVYAGIAPTGRVAPFASLVLAHAEETALTISGQRLGLPELAGATTVVHVEEFEVGRFELAGDGPLEVEFALPGELRGRPFVNVRFESDDYAYANPWGSACVTFLLRELALR